jgi:hypothetical protein
LTVWPFSSLAMLLVVSAMASRAAIGGPAVDANDALWLEAQHLIVPVEGVPSSALRPAFDERRGGRPHAALDIAAPRGTRSPMLTGGGIGPSPESNVTITPFDGERGHIVGVRCQFPERPAQRLGRGVLNVEQ